MLLNEQELAWIDEKGVDGPENDAAGVSGGGASCCIVVDGDGDNISNVGSDGKAVSLYPWSA